MKAGEDTPTLSDIFFASSNRHKFEEAKIILENFQIKLKFFKCNLEEIQSESLRKIATQKALDAFSQCKKPVIVEDDGLFINAIKGFPGPYSSYVFQTIGNKGILKLVTKNRKAKFQSIICFCDKKNGTKVFEASINGIINRTISGRGWGYDPIFVPEGTKKTFAQILNKNDLSHRFKALKKFSSWFQHKQEYFDQ